MSIENEDGNSTEKISDEAFPESQKKAKISYTREFLLSFSDLEICRKLPSGFDPSFLSEFEDTSHGIQDRPRSHGSLQGFRRNDYSSSPPTRGDSSSYSRGNYGRWDNRSSGWSDKDSDSQSDMDSESGRRYGNQPRRPWQNPEHDGLLGSGSFPRPSGFPAGTSAPKSQANDHYQLNRSNEPYHPPRPFKAVPHSRSNANDSYNDETFGSSDCASQDRAEEERKRRASFELMRKEQQKVLQEKQKLNASKPKTDCFSDLSVLLEDNKEEKGLPETNNGLDSAILSASNNDSVKSSFSSQSSTSRPLVPPGFHGAAMEKNTVPKPLAHENEVPKLEIEEIHFHGKANPLQNGNPNNQDAIQSVHEIELKEKHPGDKNIHEAFPRKGDDVVNSSSVFEVPTEKLGLGDNLYRGFGLSNIRDTVDGAEVFELTGNEVAMNKIVDNSSQEHRTSILEKLFGSAPVVEIGGSPGLVEHHDSKPADTWSPGSSQSSKFAQWFHQEEKKPTNDLLSARPNDLLSLIVGGEKVGFPVSNIKATEHIPQGMSSDGPELTNKMTSSTPLTREIPEQLYNSYKQEAIPPVPVVLTCEDLEQTILSEYSEKSSTMLPPVQEWSIPSEHIADTKEVDNHASHHLLSLLQKKASTEEMTPPLGTDIGLSETRAASEISDVSATFEKAKDASAENVQNSGQNLLLETLFGTAFMKELQSAEAPVSVQRVPAGSARIDALEPHGLSLPMKDDGAFLFTEDEVGINRRNHEINILQPNQPPKSDNIESWLRFDDPRVESNSQPDLAPKLPERGAFDGAVGIQLPEEESLITVGDSVNPQSTFFAPAGNSSKGELLSSNATFDITEKLAALNTGFRGDHPIVSQEGHHFARGPYDILDPERQYHNLHAQASSPQIHAARMGHHQRALFNPMDPHPVQTNSQMRFPEHITQHGTLPNHQFPPNLLRPPFHHPDTRVTGFDIPPPHQMLQQMQMPGAFPPPHLLRDFPRGSPVPPHISNQVNNFMQDPDAIHGFPFGHRQPNIGSLGMPLPAPDATTGGNHPEAFQRLIEMELRAKSKQIRPFNVGHSQGMYGHELDMGFRYR